MAQTVYLLALAFAVVVAVWIAGAAWRGQETVGALALAGMAVATGVWAGGTIGLALTTSPAAELRWLQVSYLGIVAAPITFVVLALEYTGYERYVTVRSVGGLLVLGSLFLGLVWTNPLHGLYWAEIEYAVGVPAGISTAPGPGFWGFVVFTYVLLLVGTVLFARYALNAADRYRNQTVAILLAVVVPWAANVPHALQVMTADYTPVALSITVAALWWATIRYRLTDLSPIALRTVFENISAGVFVLDRKDRVVEVNAAGKEMLGVTDDVIGSHAREISPDEELYEHFRDVENHREILAVEPDILTNVDASDTRYYDVQVTPIETERGRRGGRAFVVNDVTDRQRQQQQLEEQKEQFEEFASVVSHDLRNPLNVAKSRLALAREGGDEHLDHVEAALTRMETLIDDLLALAREGKKVTDPEPVDFAAVVAESWGTVETERATLVNAAEGEIVADRTRLHQLIENLVRNAIEHSDASVTVTVGTVERGFYVADDGPGIPPDDRETVFEIGYSTSEGGTGFGLNIVKQVVDAHGWEIGVSESEDGGTRFEVTGVEFGERPAGSPSGRASEN